MIGPENSRHPINQSDTKLKKQSGRGHSRFPALLEFQLANDIVKLCYHWSLGLLWYRFFDTQLKADLNWVCIDFAS